MSNVIDQKVVEMRFDNRQFENGVQTSMSTLDRLKQSLNLTGATKGLESVNSAVKGIDMLGLGNAVDTVRLRFSALQVAGVTALANITNSAVNTGKRMISALTIDPIKTGFSEYETQINAVQTILANTESKGSTLQDVNAALDTLNEYADKTIYNFTEMTKNIGTFTAAGVDLQTSVDSIKGIANLAAVSGSTSHQASTAMYQLSQALAAGRVSLMDWNSVVNAGMGGQVFQDALKRTSQVMGTGVDAAIEKYGSFRESLTQGQWLTTDVLTETLKQLSGAYTEAELIAKGYSEQQAADIIKLSETATDAATKVKTFTQLWDTLKESAQSGWTQTWEILIGDFGEAKEFLTKISDTVGGMLGASAEARNSVLSGGLSTGWKQLLGAGIADEAGYIDSIKGVMSDYGVTLDETVEKEDGFAAALKKGLKDGTVTSDMLVESVHKLGDGIRGMSEEERKAAGYTNEHITALEELEKGLDDGTISMEEFTKKIMRPSGRENLIEALWNSINGLLSVIKPIKEAFRDIFPPITSEQIYSMTENIRDFTAKLTLSDTASKNLKRTFKGLFAIVDIVAQAFSAVLDVILPLFGYTDDLGGGILEITASWGDWLVKLSESIRESGIFVNIAQKIANVIKFVADKVAIAASAIRDFALSAGEAIKNFINTAKEKIVMPGLEVISAFFDRIGIRAETFKTIFEGMKTGVVTAIGGMGAALANSPILDILQKLWEAVKIVGSGIAEAFGIISDWLVDKFSNANYSGILDFVNSLIAGGIGVGIMNFLKSAVGVFDSFSDITEGVVNVFDAIKGSLEAWQTSLKAETLKKIATAIGIIAASVLVLSLIDSDKLSESLGAITVLFADLMGSMAIFGNLSGTVGGLAKASSVMIGMSVAVLILAGAVKMIAGLDPEQLKTGVIGVVGLLGALVGASVLLGKFGGIKKGAVQMVIFAAAVKILSSVCQELAQLSWEQLAKGLVGVIALLGAVAGFMALAKFGKMSTNSAVGMVILAGALKILASVCKDFAQMNWEEIGKGLAGVGGLLAELAIFTKLTSGAKGMVSTGVGLILVGAAMKIFASAMADFAKFNWEQIGKGLTAMGGALLEVTLAMRAMPNNMISTGIGLVVVASAMIILAEALTRMSTMEWDEVGRGLTALGGSMLILAIGLNAMRGTLSGAAALLVASVALSIFTPILKTLGDMSWQQIVTGLVAIAGAFAVLGIAGLLLQPLVPIILSLSASLALVGLGMVGIGAGLVLIGLGLSGIAIGFSALATSLTGGAIAITSGLTVIITGIASLIPVIIEKLGEGLIRLCDVIADAAPAFAEAVIAIIIALTDILIECVPPIVDAIFVLLDEILRALAEYSPMIVEHLFNFLIGVLNALTAKIPELNTAIVNLVATFFSSLVEAIQSIDPDILVKAVIGVGLVAALMWALASVAGIIPAALTGAIGVGLVIAELAGIIAIIGGLAQLPGLDWLISEGGDLLQTLGVAIGQFVGGIVGGVAEGATSTLPQVGTNLSDFMTNLEGFIEGAKSIDPTMLEGVNALASAILTLTGANLLESIASFITGESSITAFGSELGALATYLNEFASNLGTFDESKVATVTCAANAIKTLAEAASTIPNEGGFAGALLGENSIATFANKLPSLATNLNAFATNLGSFDETKVATVTCAANAIKTMAEAADLIPNDGGWVAKLVGENSIADFADKLPAVGTNLSAFASNLGTFDESKVATVGCAANAIKVMAEAANGIDGQADWAKKLFGDNSLGAFSEELASVGTNLKDFATNLGTFDEAKVATVNQAVNVIKALSDLANSDLKTGNKYLTDFSEQLPDFGTDISTFVTNLPDGASIYAAVDHVKKIVNMMESISKEKVAAFENFSESLKDIGTDGVDSFVKAFTSNSAKTDVKKAAQDLIMKVVEGAESKQSKIGDELETIAKNAASEIENARSAFYDAGSYLVDGFVAGIDENDYKAAAAAAAMATAARQAAEEALGVESPSKVFYGIGRFTGMGFVNALNDYGTRAYNAGSEMADSARMGLSNAIGKISDIVNNDIDSQPTIRPVLDLSDIRSGASTIDGLLNSGVSTGVLARVGTISSDMNTIQNGANSDIVSAIDKLRDSLSNVGGNTTIVDGITYDDGSNITDAVKTLVRAAKIERRV